MPPDHHPQDGVPKDSNLEVMYVGCLPVEIGLDEQEASTGVFVLWGWRQHTDQDVSYYCRPSRKI